jgi:uncharacterized protein
MTSKSILLSILVLISPISYSASFDCNKASTVTEKLICSNKSLGYFDEDLGGVYKSLMATFSSPERSQIVLEQKQWIKERNSECVSVKDCKEIYKNRISTLRKKLDEGVLLDSFIIDRQSCRATKKQEVLIKCVNLNIYDPCEDAGGKWGKAQCGWIHSEIASRKSQDLYGKIKKRIAKNASNTEEILLFDESILSWEDYRDKHCVFTNEANFLDNFNGTNLSIAYCKRRLNEQRVVELEKILSRSW